MIKYCIFKDQSQVYTKLTIYILKLRLPGRFRRELQFRKLSCNLFQVVYSCDFCLNIMKKSCVSHKPWSRKMLETKFLSTLYVLPCRKFQFVQMTFPWSWHHLSRICRSWMLNKVTRIRQSYVVWKFPASFWLNNISCVCALNDRDLELAQLDNVSKRDILFREHFSKYFRNN